MFSLAAQSSSGTSWVILIVVYAVIFGGFYMIFMRPQKKEQKRVQAMINEMEVGDTVLTTSGFYGVLIDISDEDVIVEFGSNKNCRIPMQRKQQSHRLKKLLQNKHKKQKSGESVEHTGSSFLCQSMYENIYKKHRIVLEKIQILPVLFA